MTEIEWYQAVFDESERAVSKSVQLDAALRLTFGVASEEVFYIREPEVRSRGLEWNASNFYDGRRLGLDDAIAIAGAMAEDGRFWCGLESERTLIQMGESSFYVGLKASRKCLGNAPQGLEVYRVQSSPYEAEVQTPYESVTAGFWSELGTVVDDSGPRVLLRQWRRALAVRIGSISGPDLMLNT